jgi:hypothetical protein
MYTAAIMAIDNQQLTTAAVLNSITSHQIAFRGKITKKGILKSIKTYDLKQHHFIFLSQLVRASFD